jgi:gliding motility-associated-like protein
MKKLAVGIYSYKVSVTDHNGCESDYSNEVSGEILELPETPEITASSSLCFGGTVTFRATSGYSAYEWTELLSGKIDTISENSVSQTATGEYSYTLRVVETNGCWSKYTNNTTREIYEKPETPEITPNQVAICGGENVVLSATKHNSSTYNWYKNGTLVDGNASSEYTTNVAGNYTVDVKSSHNCISNISAAATVEIENIPETPQIYADGSPAKGIIMRNVGTTINFTVNNADANSTYQWTQNGSALLTNEMLNLTNLLPSDAGVYSVVAYSQKAHCQSQASSVELQIVKDIFVPKILSPNGDGDNDVLKIIGTEIYKSVEITIINRWGNEVFRSANYDNTWDGNDLPDGVYFYKLKLTDTQNYVSEETGYFHIKKN